MMFVLAMVNLMLQYGHEMYLNDIAFLSLFLYVNLYEEPFESLRKMEEDFRQETRQIVSS